MKSDINKRICDQCNRVLQKSLHDRCMFCGAEIPENMKLSLSQKEELKKEYDKRSLERQKHHRKWNGSDYGGGIGGDICDFGGDGD